EPLVDGGGPDGVRRFLRDAAVRSADFASRYRGRVAELDACELTAAMVELSAIRELTIRAFMYGQLSREVDLDDDAASALYQAVVERRLEIEQTVRFFELEWAALPRVDMERMLDAAGTALDFAARHLRRIHDAGTELLSPAEERVLSETAATSRVAWTRLAGELSAAIRFEIDGEEVGVGAILSLREDRDRGLRQRAQEAFAAALEPGLRSRAFAYNALLHGHATLDRLRGRGHWLDAKNRENEISGAEVQALIDAVISRYDISHRWYRLKARLLGLDRLADYDVFAPVGSVERRYSYSEARELVLESYGSFSPRASGIVARFFDESWIDAPPRPAKYFGAFCESEAPAVHPFVLLNYRGRFGDVMTMAHELGHGLHGVLAAPGGIFHVQAPTIVAETASIFGETLLADRMLAEARDDRERLAIIGLSIDGAMKAVHWQIAFNRFEDAAHTRRRSDGELAPDVLNGLWSDAMGDWYGDAVQPTPGMEREWSIVPHFFFDVPGYVYGYAFGQLLALAAYTRYREVGEPFVDDYLAMLAAGRSRSPQQLAAMIGIDLSDPGFWSSGLALIDMRLREAETLAGAGAR
ncbi:MAG: M3 family oligoendopeptidase, partial [Solirubrobacteraceae bacterium]